MQSISKLKSNAKTERLVVSVCHFPFLRNGGLFCCCANLFRCRRDDEHFGVERPTRDETLFRKGDSDYGDIDNVDVQLVQFPIPISISAAKAIVVVVVMVVVAVAVAVAAAQATRAALQRINQIYFAIHFLLSLLWARWLLKTARLSLSFSLLSTIYLCSPLLAAVVDCL